MRFICDNCNAKYSIADHKVQKKVLKIRCKRCSNVIIVRDPSSQHGQGQHPAPTGPTQPQRTPRAQPAPAQPSYHSPQHHQPSTHQPSTHQPSTYQHQHQHQHHQQQQHHHQQQQHQQQQQQIQTSAHFQQRNQHVSFDELPASQDQPAERSERTMVARISADWLRQLRDEKKEEPVWFAAIHGNPHGPVVLSEVLSFIAKGDVTPESLVWKAGWPDWIPAADVPELSPSFPNSEPPPPPPLPAAPSVQELLASADSQLDASLSQLDPHSSSFQTQPTPPVDEPRPDPFARFSGKTEPENTPRSTPAPFSHLQEPTPLQARANNETPTPKNDPYAPKNDSFSSPFPAAPAAPAASAKRQQPLQQDDPLLGSFPSAPAPLQSPTSPSSMPRQDVAMEEQALPAELDSMQAPDLAESSEEEQFFAREIGFGESSIDNGVLEVTLPPLPSQEEEFEDEEFDVADADIIEIRETIQAKWTTRLAVGGSLAILLILVLPFVMFESPLKRLTGSQQNTNGDNNVKRNRTSTKLTAAQRAQRDRLLQGLSIPANTPTKKIRRRRRRRTRAPRKGTRIVRRRRGSTTTTTVAIAPKRRLSAIEQARQDAIRSAMQRISNGGKKKARSRKNDGDVPAGLTRAMYKRILRTLNRNMGKVKYCYEMHLRKVVVQGRLLVEIQVQPNGSVSNVSVLSRRFRKHAITRCITRNMRYWQFDSFNSSEPIRLQVPYDLKPQY